MYRFDGKPSIYQGEVDYYESDRAYEIQNELLFYIKEKGLTISQATEILKDLINILPNYGTLITDIEYEKLTGRDSAKRD